MRITWARIIIPIVVIGFAALLLNSALTRSGSRSETRTSELVPVTGQLAALSATPPGSDTKIEGSGPGKRISPAPRILPGGPPKDGIPSIDKPKFISSTEADSWLQGSDWVIGVRLGKEARAYPLQILVWHEIVNDEIDGVPILVSYCPLCFSSIGFYRVIEGQAVEFGTSGKLYNSDLVMYDRKTDTYWSQILGQGLVGELAGYKLKRLPVDVMRWADWKNLYPNTRVLSRDTGHARPYGSDPYGSYYTSPTIFFPVEHEDSRLFPKEIIFGINLNGVDKAYTNTDLASLHVVNDEVGGEKIVVLSPQKDAVRAFFSKVDQRPLIFEYRDGKFLDTATGSEWDFNGEAIAGPLAGSKLAPIPGHTSFWFAWATFYQNTQLRRG